MHKKNFKKKKFKKLQAGEVGDRKKRVRPGWNDSNPSSHLEQKKKKRFLITKNVIVVPTSKKRKKERFHSAGYRAQDLLIAGLMLYHLSYIRPAIERSWARYPPEWNPSFFQRKIFQNIYWILHLVLNDVDSKSQVDKVDVVEFRYHGEWYTLLITQVCMVLFWNSWRSFPK